MIFSPKVKAGLSVLGFIISCGLENGMTASALQTSPTTAFKFTVIGDWGDNNNKRDRVASLLNRVNGQQNVQFTISVGDNFYDNGVNSASDAQLSSKWERIYNTPQPWYIVEGNHDWNGNSRAQIEYGKTHPKWILPDFYYDRTFDVAPGVSLHLVFIDTEIIVSQALGKEAKLKHMEWLEKVLQASKATWLFVVGHIPVYSVGNHGPNDVLINEVDPILNKYKVNGYIAGHDHLSEHLESQKIAYITTGDGGRIHGNQGAPNLKNPVNPTVLWYNAQDAGGIILADVHNASSLSLSYLLADNKTPGYTITLDNKRGRRCGRAGSIRGPAQ